MLDYLKLDVMRSSLSRKIRSTEYPSYNPIQLIREIVCDEYTNRLNNSIEKGLRLAKLKGSDAQVEHLKSGNGRLYQDHIIEQLSTLEFVSDRRNVAVFGESGVGKTYCSKALGVEACKNGFRTLFTDFTDLVDTLCVVKQEDLKQFRKKLLHYSRIQVLILDDFLINHLDEERSVIVFNLIKKRDELGTTTIITSQYEPSTWTTFMEKNGNYAMADSIRRRLLNNGITVLIEKAE
jgi:DNA replication protein DnaC